MYRHLYGLKDKPFQISTDPAFLWLGGKHKEALAVLVYGVRNSKGFLLLSGGVGTGKTTLIRSLLGQLDRKVTVATVHDPGLTPMDFFNFIAVAYGMRKRYTNKIDFLFDFEDLLRKTRAAGRTALLIVDEAQRLDQTLLEEIRLLSNIEDPDQKLLNVFFVGQEEFLDIISAPQNRALKQRITINYHLETLSMEETEQLVRHRLKVAGATRDVFTADAFPGIFAFSLGAPRLINILCDHALLTGFVHNVDTIGADIIAECTQDLMLPGEQAPGRQTAPPAVRPRPTADTQPATVTAGMMLQNAPPPAERRLWPWAAALLLLAAGLGLLWQRGWQPLTDALHRAQATLSRPATPSATTAEPAPLLLPATAEPSPPAPALPERIARSEARPNEADPGPTPDRPEMPEAEPPIAQARPEPRPDPANPTPYRTDPSAPGSDRAAPLGPAAAAAPAATAGPMMSVPVARSEARPRDADLGPAPDRPETPEAEPPITQARPEPRPDPANPTPDQTDPSAPGSDRTAPLGPAAAAAPAATAAQETLPAAAAPPVPPPVAPARAARTPPLPREQPPLAVLPNPASSTAPGPARDLSAGATATAPAPLPYPTEDKIRNFIQSYRKAYESRDINRFRLFFAADAMEQNRPFNDALPVYQRNFEALAALEYDITLKAWEEDVATRQVTLRGRFKIRYRMPEDAWRLAQGEISMELEETGGVYRIKRLDYWKE